MKPRINWSAICFAALAGVLAAQCYSLAGSLTLERDRSNAYLSRIRAMTPCDEAVRESREILQRQIQLRKDSESLAQNTKGYNTYDDREYVSGNY